MAPRNRSRITLSPLRTSLDGFQGLAGERQPPASWDTLADLQRGDGSGGVLVRNKQTGLYALWTGAGSIQTLPQHKVPAALNRMKQA